MICQRVLIHFSMLELSERQLTDLYECSCITDCVITSVATNDIRICMEDALHIIGEVFLEET